MKRTSCFAAGLLAVLLVAPSVSGAPPRKAKKAGVKPAAAKGPTAARSSDRLPPGAKAPPQAETKGDAQDERMNMKVDTKQFLFVITPGKRVLDVGEELSFSARVQKDGYLVVLQRDTNGKVLTLFPESRKADDARVSSGQTVAIPGDNQGLVPESAGNHWLKAFLFTTREQAEAALTKPLGLFPDANVRDLVRVKAQQPGYVAHVKFEVKK